MSEVQSTPTAKPRLSYSQFVAARAAHPTVSQLIERYMQTFPNMSVNQVAQMHVLQRAPLGAKVAEHLVRNDYREHAVLRKANGVPTFIRRKERLPQLSGATVGKDFAALSVVFTHAHDYWDVPVNRELLKQAIRMAKKERLIASPKKRERRPTPEEIGKLLALFEKQNGNKRTKIDMVLVTEFSYEAGRRISETCRMRRKDVDVEKRTYWVHDLKSPGGKGVSAEAVLLGRAWDIVVQRLAVIADDPGALLFPYNSRSCSSRYTEAKKALGIPDLRLHDNRRECYSRLFEQGYSVPEVQHGVSLHKGEAKTLVSVYTKLHPEDLLKGPAALRRLQLEQRAHVN